ncbi:hypothetical protein B0A48_04314 [Cryoendolithus antarcticus]|uniref:F-box domain-containing protein n=1 Tax=Cryoendolithus antarcticus TaxID=1507870 RepID=A0A1V8TF05_9PEZI|nr:hypothetical protein B0A48_04314 [Cryoendolithus antarcticus]
MAADRLTSLPTELLTKVLEVLPVREIYGLRIVSGDMKNFIDSNEDVLVHRTILSTLTRLYARFSWLMRLEGLGFIDILRRYCYYYGDVELDTAKHGQPIFTAMLGETLIAKFLTTEEEERNATAFKVLELWMCFLTCHVWIHRGSSSSLDANHNTHYCTVQRA